MGKIVPKMGINYGNANILFSKTRQRVLSLLYRFTDRSFFTRQIIDNVKMGRGSVQRELEILTYSGIITREVSGKQIYYKANDKCPIFNELKSIITKTFGVADVIYQELEPVVNDIQLAFIFGSIARNAETAFSDIDLIIIGNLSFEDACLSVTRAEEILGREINPVVYDISEFKKRIVEKHHFVSSLLEGEKIFVIGGENELAGLVGGAINRNTSSL